MAAEDRKPEPTTPKVKSTVAAQGLLATLAAKERELSATGKHAEAGAVSGLSIRLASTKAYLDNFDASLVPEIKTLKASL